MDADAAKVSGRQRRRPAMQADGVAEVQAKWRGAPSVRALSACCLRSCWGEGRANGRNEPGRRLWGASGVKPSQGWIV